MMVMMVIHTIVTSLNLRVAFNMVTVLIENFKRQLLANNHVMSI